MNLTIEEKDLRLRLASDFEAYAKACLRIRTKAGAIAPLTLNRSQRHVHDRLEAQIKSRGRVRALILKGRQVGISTYVGARFYWKVTHKFGFRAFILAHLDASSAALFDIAHRFHEQCPTPFRPATGRANVKELSFAELGGGYKVATAGSAEIGRGETLQLFHGSEVGHWQNAQRLSAGIQQAIADVAGTECVLESTASGIGNAFHAQWAAAMRGDSDFEAIFVPWYWHEEYQAVPDRDWCCPQAWAEYGSLYGISPQQVYWAWRKNRELAVTVGGSADEPGWLFQQEYPANAEEAFQTSGADTFIPTLAVMKARKATVEGYGPLIIGVDPARGGRDKTGIIDRQGRRAGAHVCKRVNFGEDAMAVAGHVVHLRNELRREHDTIYIVIDATGLGGPIYDRLREQLPHEQIIGVNFGERADNSDRYLNRRSEMYDKMREWFADPAGVQVPDSDELHGDLTAIVRGPGATRFDSAGRLVLEAKDHVRERLGFSPDLSDALALTLVRDFSPLYSPEVVDRHRRDRHRHWEQRDPWSF